jgi:putative addiction module component (TIGR02574 family)
MARTVQEIEAEIRKLAVPDRDRLLRDLVADLDGTPDQEIEAAWLAEAQKRYEELRSGTVKAVPADEVIRKARARLKHGN